MEQKLKRFREELADDKQYIAMMNSDLGLAEGINWDIQCAHETINDAHRDLIKLHKMKKWVEKRKPIFQIRNDTRNTMTRFKFSKLEDAQTKTDWLNEHRPSLKFSIVPKEATAFTREELNEVDEHCKELK